MILKALAIFFLVVVALRLALRLLLPFLGKLAVKKVSQNMQKHNGRANNGEKIYQKGDVEIRKASDAKDRDDGEFTAYEEVQ